MTFMTAMEEYWAYFLWWLFAMIRELLSKVFKRSTTPTPKGYAPLVKGFEDFWIRRFYGRVSDCYNRPITNTPGATVEVLDRVRVGKEFELTGTSRKCVNLGSYNYLGFADQNDMIRDSVKSCITKYGVATASPSFGAGDTDIHRKLEEEIASFVGKPAAIINPMGFATNALTIPGIVGKGDLVVSDSLNHASIIVGARSSGASVKVFEHNDPKSLESLLRSSIRRGHPKYQLPWKKILVIVEGIYSMEGEICKLKEISQICKRYKAYLWLDEAHSIGCMGKSGRGICEHSGTSPDDVDVLMGTFTKSFGSVGGYVAGSKEFVDYIRAVTAPAMHYATMSPACAQQVISALHVMTGKDGTDLGQQKLRELRENSNLFRSHLKGLGCHVLGDKDSPVIPLMLYHPCKITAFSQLCLERNIAVVVVGYPATPLLLSRVRFCMCAAHTPETLKKVLQDLEEVIDMCGLRYSHDPFARMWAVYEHVLDFFGRILLNGYEPYSKKSAPKKV